MIPQTKNDEKVTDNNLQNDCFLVYRYYYSIHHEEMVLFSLLLFVLFFFFNDTATTEIYTLSLHDALPISLSSTHPTAPPAPAGKLCPARSEEHTSELQSQSNLVCRLLLEKKKKTKKR